MSIQLSSSSAASALTVGKAQDWLSQSGERHSISGARVLAASIKKLADCRSGEEPDSVDWMLENLDTLAERLSRKEQIKRNSMRSYISRARTGLEAFKGWSHAPMGWKWSPKRQARKEPSAKTPIGSQENPSAGSQETTSASAPRSLKEEIDQALIAMAGWPRLRPYLLPGVLQAIEADKGES